MSTIPDDYQPAQNALQGQILLITGAGDGLGKTLALGCASLGASVILLGKTVAKLEAIYDEIAQNNHYPQAAIYPLDLAGANTDHYQELAETLRSTYGQLDGLIHCAAQLGPMMPLTHYPATDWIKTLQTNVTGPAFLTQACLPVLMKSESASVIFTLDDKSIAYWGAYGVSKGALESTMRIYSDELESRQNMQGQRQFTINGVIPGPMRTHIRRKAFPGENMQSIPRPECYLNDFIYLLDRTKNRPYGEVICTNAAQNPVTM